MGVHHTSHRIAPLTNLIPAAHIAVVPFYLMLLVCVSNCGQIVPIFHLSFNMHGKKTNHFVLKG